MGFFPKILDLIFPPKCVFCNSYLKKSEDKVCAKCSRSLPLIPTPAYMASGFYFDVCVSPLYYTGIVRNSIRRFKFGDRQENAEYYGHLLAECIAENLTGRYDLITWVPLSSEHKKERGYDQSMLICMAAALELDNVAVETLIKIKNTYTQSRLSHDERSKNVREAYISVDSELIQGKRILLIDDIITTGATLSECAKTLRASGAKSVVCATLARSPQL